MNVALGAIEARRLFDHRDQRRRLEITGLSRLHLGIPRLLGHQRQPADLELGAGRDDQIGAAGAGDEARLRFDVMRVLQRVRRGVDLDLVAAQLFDQRAPLRDSGKDVEVGERGCGPNAKRGGE